MCAKSRQQSLQVWAGNRYACPRKHLSIALDRLNSWTWYCVKCPDRLHHHIHHRLVTIPVILLRCTKPFYHFLLSEIRSNHYKMKKLIKIEEIVGRFNVFFNNKYSLAVYPGCLLHLIQHSKGNLSSFCSYAFQRLHNFIKSKTKIKILFHFIW